MSMERCYENNFFLFINYYEFHSLINKFCMSKVFSDDFLQQVILFVELLLIIK